MGEAATKAGLILQVRSLKRKLKSREKAIDRARKQRDDLEILYKKTRSKLKEERRGS